MIDEYCQLTAAGFTGLGAGFVASSAANSSSKASSSKSAASNSVKAEAGTLFSDGNVQDGESLKRKKCNAVVAFNNSAPSVRVIRTPNFICHIIK